MGGFGQILRNPSRSHKETVAAAVWRERKQRVVSLEKFKNYHELKSMTMEELERYYNANAKNVGAISLSLVRDELARREQSLQLLQISKAIESRLTEIEASVNWMVRRGHSELEQRRETEIQLSAAAQRWMVFIDGENLAIQGRKVLESSGIELPEERSKLNWPGQELMWLPGLDPRRFLTDLPFRFAVQPAAIRAHYYSCASGSSVDVEEAVGWLGGLGFHPNVFHKKKKEKKRKQVDITLSKDFLSHAFQDNYDMALLIAGDRDYLPLIEEVQRLGKIVILAFFDSNSGGLSTELKATCDEFIDLSNIWKERWAHHIHLQKSPLFPQPRQSSQ